MSHEWYHCKNGGAKAWIPSENEWYKAAYYDHAKWLLERVENFPKNQRFVLGQRLAAQAMDVLDLPLEASYARDKAEILATANHKMEVLRWTVRTAKDRKLFTAAQFEFSAGGGV